MSGDALKFSGLKWGIVGTEEISQIFVEALLKLSDKDHQVVAVADQSINAAREFASENGISKHYSCLRKFAEDNDVDIVFVACLISYRAEVCTIMLEKNKHVVCDHPLTLTLTECFKLIALAKKQELFLMEGIWSRAYPAYSDLREVLKQKVIGDIKQVNCTFGGAFTEQQIFYSKEKGAQRLLDVCMFGVQFQQFVFEKRHPKEVFVAEQLTHPAGGEESINLIIKYENGEIASIQCGVNYNMPNEACIIGTKGFVKVPEFWAPKRLGLQCADKESVDCINPIGSTCDGMKHEIEAVKICIDNGILEYPGIPWDQSLELAEIRDIIRKQVPLRWGLIGTSLVGHDFATALRTLSPIDHLIIAVVNPDSKKAQSFAGLHHIHQHYRNVETLAKDPNIDIVYVDAPVAEHYTILKTLLQNGKHVVCGKPFARTLKQTLDIVDLAKARKLFLMEAIWSRCFPAYKELRKQLNAGCIGDVKQVNVGFGCPLETVHRFMQRDPGGGTLYDLLIYTLQFQQFVFDRSRPSRVLAIGHLCDQGTDTSINAVIQYPHGKSASIQTSAYCQLANEAVIIGTRGKIIVPNFWCPTQLILPKEKIINFALPESTLSFNFMNSVGLQYQAIEVRECIVNGVFENESMPLDDSVLLADILDKIRQSVGICETEDGA